MAFSFLFKLGAIFFLLVTRMEPSNGGADISNPSTQEAEARVCDVVKTRVYQKEKKGRSKVVWILPWGSGGEVEPSMYWIPQGWSRIFLHRSPSWIISSSELGMDFWKQQWLVSCGATACCWHLFCENIFPSSIQNQWCHFHICCTWLWGPRLACADCTRVRHDFQVSEVAYMFWIHHGLTM